MQDTPAGGILLRELMDAFETPEFLRPGVISIVTGIRNKHSFDGSEAARDVARRVSAGLVKTKPEMDRLIKLFDEASVADISTFLSSPDMTVDEFAAIIRKNATVSAARRIADEIELRLDAGVPFSAEERSKMLKLRDMLSEVLPDSATDDPSA